MSSIAENIKVVRERMESACRRAGRNPSEIKLVAVSKTVDINRIREAVLSGISIIGENRVQEAREKIEEFNRLQTSDFRLQTVSWHMVGHLQTNKAKTAVMLFDLIHSVDSLHLAEEIDRQAGKVGKIQKVLLEVNLAGEETKHGIPKEDAIDLLKEISKLNNISVEGLMTIPPFTEDPEEARPYFKELRELRDRTNGLRELSMGMSNDFEIAIEEGATIVRIGTAIFGERK